MLQTVWGYKELRRTLEKDGWKKTDFMVNLNPPANTRTNGGYEDSTLPLIDRGSSGEEKEKKRLLRGHILKIVLITIFEPVQATFSFLTIFYLLPVK